MMRAAVNGTLSLMVSADRASRAPGGGRLKSLAFMSSISAVFSTLKCPGDVVSSADWNDEAEPNLFDAMHRLRRSTTQNPKLATDLGYAIYQASKTTAERALWDFALNANPRFDIMSFCPW